MTMVGIFFNDFSLFIYGIFIFLLINFYEPSAKKFNWLAVILTGVVVALIYVIFISLAAQNAGELAWVGITGIPASLISGVISAFLTNLVIILVKNVMNKKHQF